MDNKLFQNYGFLAVNDGRSPEDQEEDVEKDRARSLRQDNDENASK